MQRRRSSRPGGGVEEAPVARADQGYVSRLELVDFKSWAGVNTVPFTPGFNAVVGPNGSGKSNVMDALSFVCGVTARKLRGDTLRDMVYDGDNNAASSNRSASVALYYSCGDNEVDNKEKGEELVFRRSVQGTASVYEIDGRKVSHEIYEGRLKKIGVLADAKNFLVFQGDVEQMAQKSPVDLCKFIEQVSGSDELAPEYDRLRAEKEKFEVSALEAIARKKEIVSDRKEAKEQKEETQLHTELCDKRNNESLQRVMFRIAQEKKRGYGAEQDAKRHEVRGEELTQVELAMAEEVKLAKAQVSTKSREASKADTQAAQISKQCAQLATAHAKKAEAFARAKSRRRDLEVALRSAREALATQEEEKAALAASIAGLRAREEELVRASTTYSASASINEAGLEPEVRARLQELRVQADEETATTRSEIARLERELTVQAERVELHRQTESQLEQRVVELETELAQLEKRKTKMDASVAVLEQRVQEGERAAQEELANAANAAKELEEKREELERAKGVLSGAKARSQETKRNKKLSETVQALARHFEGVKGRLVELVRPTHRKYALALDTALGRHMDSIVVDRETTAFECVKYLREQRLGVATFLPLDTMRAKPISESRKAAIAGQDAYRLSHDLIEYDDPSVAKAVLFACGDTVVCETLQDARRLRFQRGVRVKCVTLDGHVIAARGEMTGGSTTFGEGRVDRFAESALQAARDARERLEREIAALESKAVVPKSARADFDVMAVNAQNRLKFAKTDAETTGTRIAEARTRLTDARAALEASRPKGLELTARSDALKAQIEQLRVDIVTAEQRIFAELGDLPGLAGMDPREVQRRDAEARATAERTLAELREQLGKLESQLRYIESRDRAGAVEQSEQVLARSEEECEEAEREANEAKSALDEADAARAAAEATKETVKADQGAAQAKVQDAAARLSQASKDRAAEARKATAAQAIVNRVRATIEEIVRQASLDGLDVPRRDATPSSGTPTSTSSIASEFDLSSLRNELALKPLLSPKQFEEEDAEIAATIKRLSEEIEALAPNARASAKFDEANERLKESDVALAEAREAAKAADEAFAMVRKARFDKFMAMFNHVSARIDGVYKELTKRESAPQGGSAFLALEDIDNPFLAGVRFEVMPPNKRFRMMESLSGGEKTVAALALLFSVHTFRPSPFFVMDEVDAALDNDNVGRVSAYIRARTSELPAEPTSDETPPRFQALVISLKDQFFEKADTLVGVYREVNQLDASKHITLDLTPYEL